MLIDVHTHLENESEYVKCINATGPKDWEEVRLRAKKDKNVIPFFGLHPWYVFERKDGWEEELKALLKKNKAGIGEVGLDKNHKDFKGQLRVFESECQFAVDLDRPMMIHSVKSIGHVLDVIRGFKKTPPRFALHAFKGSKESVREIEKLEGYVSLSFNTDEETIKAVSPDRILVETDTYKSDLKYMVRMINAVRKSEYRGTIEQNTKNYLGGLFRW